MSTIIERTMFWFNSDQDIEFLNHKFYFLGSLLNRILNETYNGKKIKFLNIEFYNNPEQLIKAYNRDYYLHYYGGQLTYKKVVDLNFFATLSYHDQKLFVWEKAYEMLQFASKELKNESLLLSCEHAYHKGIKIELNADYRMIEADVVLFNTTYKASLWVNFFEHEMQANFTLEDKGKIIFKKFIGNAPNGMEFFFIMFKKIEQKGNCIIIKGAKDVEYLPVKILFSEKLEEL